MYHVYILRDATGRHYIGMTGDLVSRLEQHRRGSTQTTRRMVHPLGLIVAAVFATKPEAASIERKLKAWKNPAKAIIFLQQLSA